MKKNMLTMVGLMMMAMSLSSCGSFLSVGTGVSAYDDSYYYDDYSNYGLLSYSDARNQALYLSDKMAYEMGLNAAQYAAVYEINLDYLLNMRSYNDFYGSYWARRNSDLRYVLSSYQYNYYTGAGYFYRPLGYYNNTVVYNIYNRYRDPGYYYYERPNNYASYRGGHNRTGNSYYANRSFGGRTNNIRRNTQVRSSTTRTVPQYNGGSSNGNGRVFGGRVGNGQRASTGRVNGNGNFSGGNARQQTNTTRSRVGSSNNMPTRKRTEGSSNRSFGSRSTTPPSTVTRSSTFGNSSRSTNAPQRQNTPSRGSFGNGHR
ncbi:hypothetical protein [Prevotella sp. KH2C16]|uniref:hypothetical protein n=1 Tax=Prevotella sp. KH2C16 TaxID=1855325 RepID=UPI0008ED3AC1|nr:hypothetical protein [Prevotella sp. KH2C16]SFG15784.1 hypothetical protein SAMN05216383_10632 [Prevotella sp. KH2C16]